MREITDHDRRNAARLGIPVEELFRRNEPVKRFFKWGVDIADGQYPYYGGHTEWICKLLKIDYLIIGLCFKFKYYHTYYDGYHHCLYLGLVYVNWGGRPYNIKWM